MTMLTELVDVIIGIDTHTPATVGAATDAMTEQITIGIDPSP